MRNTGRLVGSIVVLVGLLFSIVPQAYAATKAGEVNKAVEVPQKAIKIQATYPDGKPLGKSQSVKIWNVKKNEFEWTGKIGEKGFCELPELEEGSYILIVSGRSGIPLKVMEGVKNPDEPVNVMVPRGKSEFAALTTAQQALLLSQIGAIETPDETPGWLGWGSIKGLVSSPVFWGGAAAVAGGTIAVIEANDDDDDDDEVSPAG